MRLISCHNGKIQTLSERFGAVGNEDHAKTFVTGLDALDQLAPGGALTRGAIHEVLADPKDGVSPRTFAMTLARAATSGSLSPRGKRGEALTFEPSSISRSPPNSEPCDSPPSPLPSPLRGEGEGAIIWCDPHADLYPPAVAAMEIPLERLFLLRPKTLAEQIWAIAECLRCKGVAAVVTPVMRLSRIEARRLQLAAEQGGGVGVLLRPSTGPGSLNYAAATRWLVAPARGERTLQRWKIQLVHGHGGRVGEAVFLEMCRRTGRIDARPARAMEKQAERPAIERVSA